MVVELGGSRFRRCAARLSKVGAEALRGVAEAVEEEEEFEGLGLEFDFCDGAGGVPVRLRFVRSREIEIPVAVRTVPISVPGVGSDLGVYLFAPERGCGMARASLNVNLTVWIKNCKCIVQDGGRYPAAHPAKT